jgi:hypothetical protein
LNEQLSFDFEWNRMEVGDRVEVIAHPEDSQDVETQSYLNTYAGRKGKLIAILKESNPVAFEVEFESGRNGIFYENEIEKIEGGNPNEKKANRKPKKTSSRTKGKK